MNDLDGVLEEFHRIVGIDKLKCIHLNDSMMEFNSRKDRHAKIGKGTIGLEAIKKYYKSLPVKRTAILFRNP